MPETSSHPTAPGGGKVSSTVVYLFVILCCAGLLLYILTSWTTYQCQWDFVTYYCAFKAAGMGFNPYVNSNLLKFTPPFIVGLLPFVYPPYTLWFFGLFALDNYQSAAHLYLFTKLVLLAALVYLWRQKFLKKEADPFFYLYCLLAFNCAIFLDIQAGNISVFLQFILWLGFYCFLKRRLLLFCALIGITSLFKMPFLFFLGLLFFSGARRKHIFLVGSIAAVLGIYAISYFSNPEFFLSLLVNLRRFDIKDPLHNLSTMSLSFYVFDKLSYKGLLTVPSLVPVVAYIAVAITVLLITLKTIRRIGGADRDRLAIFLFCVAYALITPRMKDYSYMLLIVPSFFAIKRAVDLKAYPVFLVMFMLSAKHMELPVYRVVLGDIVWSYYPLIVAYTSWFLLVFCVSRERPA